MVTLTGQSRVIEMRRLREQEGLTLQEIGDMFGISRERVRQITKNKGTAPARARHKRVFDLHEQGLPSIEIAKATGTSYTHVRHILGLRGRDIPQSVESRFWEKVNKTSTCWEWTGGCTPLGYGRFFSGTYQYAHRVSWKLHYGEIPDNFVVCHHCDNPRCVRPDHLFLDTRLGNIQDRDSKGRTNRRHVPPLDSGTRQKVQDMYKGGHSIAEIARQTNLTYSRVQRAVRKLQ